MAKQYVIKDSKGKDRVYTDVDTVTLTDIDGNDVTFTQENVYDVSNAFLVKVIDYDGTVLKSEKLNTGDVFTLPEPQLHDRLVFQEWVAPVDIVDNTVTVGESDITIGAIYTTKSGLSEFDITLTKVSGLSITLNMDGTKDWGDGTSDTATSHTYADYGDYMITCDGTTMSTSSSTGLFGQGTSEDPIKSNLVRNVRIGASVQQIPARAFHFLFQLKCITIPNTVTVIGPSAFTYCYALKSFISPPHLDLVDSVLFSRCGSLIDVVLPKGLTKINSNAFDSSGVVNIQIPQGTTSIAGQVFYQCYQLRKVSLPNTLESINSYAFQNCYALERVSIPSSVTSIDSYIFQYCRGLKELKINSPCSTLSGICSNCYSLQKVSLAEGLTTLSNNAFTACYALKEVILPSTLQNISGSVFNACHACIKYDFSACSSIPSLSTEGGFKNINSLCKIYVPDSLYEEWIVATNWVSYADYIYKASEMLVE